MKSYWIESSKKTQYPKIVQDIKTDVCIIGGGITGITLRIYTFQRRKKSLCNRKRRNSNEYNRAYYS